MSQYSNEGEFIGSEDMERIIQQNAKENFAFLLGDELSDGICLYDSKGIIIAVNNEYLRIFGEKEEDILYKHVNIFVEKGYIDDPTPLRVYEEKKKLNAIITIKTNNNIAMVTSIPIFDKDGEVEQVLTVIRDLTEITKLHQQLERVEKKNKKYLKELTTIKEILRKSDDFIGENIKIKKIKEIIKAVAKTDATIMISAETGCGKEILAKEIHKKSDRKNHPYIKINCAAIPESLIESELFGYEQGAFTGAVNKGKKGMFELANGGTILLDEIGEMPMQLQTKLLRVLQEKELMRIGGTSSIKLDVRVIAATNQNLEELVAKKEFRQDLFYRLNVIPISIPPLRERRDDIALLAYNFVNKYNLKYNKNVSLTNRVLSLLEQHNWPGNVRELENVIERLVVITTDEELDYNFVMDMIQGRENDISINTSDVTLKEALESLEKEMIRNALSNHGSTYKAAEALGMNQSSIFRKAKAYDLL